MEKSHQETSLKNRKRTELKGSKPTKNTQRREAVVRALAILLLLISGSSPQTWDTTPLPAGETTTTDCQSWNPANNEAMFYKILVLNNNPNRLSIRTVDLGSVTVDKFVDETSTGAADPKKYASYPLSSNCYMFKNPDTRNKVILLALMITKSATAGCQVERILTNTDLEACSGSHEDILGMVDFLGEGAMVSSFSSIKYKADKKVSHSTPFLMKFKGLVPTAINEAIMDMVTLEPFVEANVEKTVMIYNKDLIDLFSQGQELADNSYSTPINLANYLPRLVKGHLPGYFLGEKLAQTQLMMRQFSRKWTNGA